MLLCVSPGTTRCCLAVTHSCWKTGILQQGTPNVGASNQIEFLFHSDRPSRRQNHQESLRLQSSSVGRSTFPRPHCSSFPPSVLSGVGRPLDRGGIASGRGPPCEIRCLTGRPAWDGSVLTATSPKVSCSLSHPEVGEGERGATSPPAACQ